jgi:osmotically-inducible protein OsmY
MEPQTESLEREVYTELVYEPSVDALNIEVSARADGVIALKGVVRNYAEKIAAERAAKRVRGVHAVVNDLDVRLASAHARTDVELAEAVVQALEWNVLVPRDCVQGRVADGWVRLEGTVDWNYQRTAAEEAIHRLAGIQGVTNRIIVKPQVAIQNVKALIDAALRRSADLEAQQIQVKVQDNRVILRGQVHSWTEREAAEAAAWSAPGVAAVDDELQVTT